jgi:thiamine biosynthesis lipoprotein
MIMSSQTFTFEAIGTHFWIEIFDDITDTELESSALIFKEAHADYKNGNALGVKGRFELLSSTFNQHFSRFRTDSDVGTLNEDRQLDYPSDECRAILLYGKQLYLRSQGTFNILGGHILEARGYNAHYTFTAAADVDTLEAANPLTDLTITESKITLTSGNIDIGGYGKGWLIDKLANDLKAHGVEHFLINGGGDMYATSDAAGSPITIYLEHPTIVDQYLIETTLHNQGFAASSPFKRRWKSGEKIYHHIVATTDVPEIATFVKAHTATDADAFATVAMLLPEDSLPTLAIAEQLAIARFDPHTNQLWQTTNFS